MARFSNFVLFYVGWFACAAGAGRGALWVGPATAAVLLLAHVALTAERVREAALIVVVGALGFGIDTLQARAGLYAFAGTSVLPWLCPPWMTALWMLFAITLNGSMAWLGKRYGLAAVLGAVAGPASYLAGERLGAIALSSNKLVSLGGIAIVWALVMPALLWIREAVSRAGVRDVRHLVRLPMAMWCICGALFAVSMVSRPGMAAEIEGVRFADRVRSAT